MILEIWKSFRSMPTWVQIWVAFILAPVNMASLAFLSEPSGLWIAFLANIAMMMNMPVMLYDRGFSKLMALPHLLPWTILVIWLVAARPIGSDIYNSYLSVLLVINTISLLFDYPDALHWKRGDRQPSRPQNR
ncbi:MAG: hypothetical protein KUG74_17475 [Rhodobacteraceae bacterium]|nr:hypothetical protein [Paracoccaceae bacterium]